MKLLKLIKTKICHRNLKQTKVKGMKVVYSGPEGTSQVTHPVPSMKSMIDESVAWKYFNTRLNHVKCYRPSMH